MNDYQRIAEIIRYLDTHHAEQPDLETLAQQIGLSPFHLHRLFRKWAAITPKAFLQCLSLNHAKELLAEGRPVLETALDLGYSGPGRLHDLCVTLEAVSPGEWKSGGAGLTITAGFAETPFGRALIAQTPRGICHLSFLDSADAEGPHWAWLKESWPEAKIERDDPATGVLAPRIFASPNPDAPLRVLVRGTAFQVRVWRALLGIPFGSLRSYGQIAGDIGTPKSARAVGSAIGRNAIGFLIPCHRVIRQSGVIGDYRWGSTRKRALIAWETAKTRLNPVRR